MTMRRQNGICAGVGRVVSQHSVRWLSAVAVVIVTIVAVVFATSAASAGTPDRGRIIHLQTKLVSATTNPAGLRGPGDVIANLNAFTTSSGVVGHADITCQIFPNSEQECVASFVFPNGQIDTTPPSRFHSPGSPQRSSAAPAPTKASLATSTMSLFRRASLTEPSTSCSPERINKGICGWWLCPLE